MSLLDQLADAHIQTAIDNGDLDNLPGQGQPLPPDEARHVPAELRAGYRLLKNAGFVPPEIQTHRELREVEDLLAQALPESEAHERLSRRARWIETQLSTSRRGRALLADRTYGDALRRHLAGSDNGADDECDDKQR